MDTKYTLSDLIGRVKARLKDVDYSEADITQFLNDTYFEVVGDNKWRFLERGSEYDAYSSGILPLPCDFQSVINLVAVTEGGAIPMTYIAPQDYNAKRDSFCYTIMGNDVLFSIPVSDDCEAGQEEEKSYSMRLYYLSRPMPMIKDADTTTIPTEYSEILVLGALSRAEQLRDNFDFAQIYDNKKAELITNMINRYGPRQLSGANRSVLPVSIRLEA